MKLLALLLGLLALTASACDRSRATAPAASSRPSATAPIASAARAAGPRSGVAAGLRYLELDPANAPDDARLPLVVAIHGLGGRPETFRSVLAGVSLPARIVLPYGLEPHAGGYSWFPIRVGEIDEAAVAPGLARAANRLAAMIAAVARDRPTAGKPVVTGYSQGGMLSFVLAVHHGDVVGAAFPVAGWLPRPLWPESAPAAAAPIVALHGDADDVLPIGPTRDGVATLRRLGIAAELVEYPGAGHDIPAAMRRELYRRLTEAVAAAAARP